MRGADVSRSDEGRPKAEPPLRGPRPTKASCAAVRRVVTPSGFLPRWRMYWRVCARPIRDAAPTPGRTLGRGQVSPHRRARDGLLTEGCIAAVRIWGEVSRIEQ